MRLPSRAMITWLFAALFAAAGGLGDGLHCVPGLGHAVDLPAGLLYLGLDRPHSACSGTDSQTGISGLPGGPPLVLDADQCAICGHFSRGQCVAQPVEFAVSLPLLECLPEFAIPRTGGFVSQPFDARAPPVA